MSDGPSRSQEWEHRIEPDWAAFVSIARGRARLFLSEHRGDARPDTLVGLFVSDIAPVSAEFGPPAGEQPYRCEIELRDPDGKPAADQHGQRLSQGWALGLAAALDTPPRLHGVRHHRVAMPGCTVPLARR